MFWLILDLAKSSSLVYWLFVSVPQTMPRTANNCGNIILRFAPCDDHDDLTNHFRLLKLLYTSYISLLNQAKKSRVFYSILTGDQAFFFLKYRDGGRMIAGLFYSVDKCFETGADPRNLWDEQNFKNLDAVFIGINFGWLGSKPPRG